VNHKSLDYYMNLPYTIEFTPELSDPEEPVWFAAVKELRGCMTEADTFEEAAEMIKDAMGVWIQGSLDVGLPIPEPEPNPEEFSLRLSRTLLHDLVQSTQGQEISLNQYFNVAARSMRLNAQA
jgi:antitoxin HicB